MRGSGARRGEQQRVEACEVGDRVQLTPAGTQGRKSVLDATIDGGIARPYNTARRRKEACKTERAQAKPAATPAARLQGSGVSPRAQATRARIGPRGIRLCGSVKGLVPPIFLARVAAAERAKPNCTRGEVWCSLTQPMPPSPDASLHGFALFQPTGGGNPATAYTAYLCLCWGRIALLHCESRAGSVLGPVPRFHRAGWPTNVHSGFGHGQQRSCPLEQGARRPPVECSLVQKAAKRSGMLYRESLNFQLHAQKGHIDCCITGG
jgi:hypothetical protein